MSVCLLAGHRARLPVYLSMYLPMCRSICLPACLSIHLPARVPVYLPACLSVCLSACLSPEQPPVAVGGGALPGPYRTSTVDYNSGEGHDFPSG